MSEHGKMNATVARRLRATRLILGLSQTDLADRLDFSAQQLHNYETGKSRISLDTLEHISDALGKSVESILGNGDPTLSEISKLLVGLEHGSALKSSGAVEHLHDIVASLSAPEFAEVKLKLHNLIKAIEDTEELQQKS